MLKLKNVLIADDHELIIKGIHNILQDNFDIEEIRTFTNPEEAAEELAVNHYELYILALEYQEMSGFDLIVSIRREHPSAKIIVITMYAEAWNAGQLLELNVNGIIHKKTSGDYLPKAVSTVLNGKQFLCPEFEELKAKSIAYKKLQKAKNTLPSQSELAVLKYIVDGYSSKQIAEILCVTEDTIEAHRKNLFVKLGAKNAPHLASIALRQHLLE